jgi:mannitol/fructose-specific phosphotransferase system IIA component (Ntr-type)
MLEFDPQIVLMDCTAQCREEVSGALVCAMEKAGYVTAAYTGNVLARENRYPTGLPTQGVRGYPHGKNADGNLSRG